MRLLRYGLFATLTIVGCGGDNGTADAGTPDLSVPTPPRDMAGSNLDLASGGDASAPPAGVGQMILLDVAGSRWVPNGATGETELKNTHLLTTYAHSPMFDDRVDWADLVFAPGMAHGCRVTRFNYNAGKGRNPNLDVGTVLFEGVETNLFARTAASATLTNPPIPNPACKTDSMGIFQCTFSAGTDGGANIGGVRDNFFPTVPLATYATGCPTCTCDQAKQPGQCEQHPIAAGATINEIYPGGNGYGKFTPTFAGNVPASPTIVSIKVGGTSTGSTDLQSIKLDPAKNLVVQWSCDGSTTPGSGCNTATPDELIAFITQTSQDPRSTFSEYPKTTQYGLAACFEQASSATGTVTLQQPGVAALLGTPAQATGSVWFLLARARAQVNPPGGGNQHVELGFAGHGLTGFTNLP